ncbi:MAG TPA: zinc-dependent metalloprotease [Acidimicrobiales bacterium]|nr:zinc-dependent metalloprotease [Acidimicrobiales bacterium]
MATGLVDWALAERVAGWALARRPPPAGYRSGPLEADFTTLTAQAEALVAEATGLHPPSPARAAVVDRPAWVRANVASIQRLLGPTLQKLEARRAAGPLAGLPFRLPGALAGAGRSLSGAQLGLVLAWMSSRVLGQYDLLVADDLVGDQDIVYYVGPNVVDLEQRYGFPPDQFRLWLALHEVTHRAQFTAVPWLRDHFLSLVDQGLEPLGSDPRQLVEAVRRAAGEVRSGHSPLGDAGVMGLVATPEQLDALRRIQALMSLLEGHGDVTMDRAGAAAVPGAERFSRVLRERRQQVRGPAKLLQQVLGLEAKLRQYAEGEAFVNAVEEAGGADLFNRVWGGPEWLPSLAEIREPGRWVDRVRAVPATPAVAG